MKIGIVTAGALPVPNTKGGGVETLVQHFIDENEKHGKYKVTLFSVYDEQSYNKAIKYKNTECIFIKKSYFKDRILQKLFCYIYALNRRTFKIKSIQYTDSYLKQVVKYINRSKDLKKIIIENKMSAILPIAKVFSDDIIYHSHYDDTNIYKNKFEISCHEHRLKKCKKIIVVSNFLKKRIEDATNLCNIVTLRNCIDIEKFSNLDKCKIEEYKKLYNLKENEVIIMYSGRLTIEKGVKELILAFKNLKRNLDIKLMIVGGSFYSNNQKSAYIMELEELVADIRDRVIFTGYINYNDMPYIWSLCDIGVVPTLYVEEAAGLVAIEAMACGKPLIITDSGGLPEYTNDKCSELIERESNLINNLANAIYRLFKNEKLRKVLGKNSFKHAKQFDKEMYYYQFNKIIKNEV